MERTIKDPHLRLYRLMEEARHRSAAIKIAVRDLARSHGSDNPVVRGMLLVIDKYCLLECRLRERLARTTASTPEGVLVQARALSDSIDRSGDVMDRAMYLNLAKSIVAGLERLR